MHGVSGSIPYDAWHSGLDGHIAARSLDAHLLRHRFGLVIRGQLAGPPLVLALVLVAQHDARVADMANVDLLATHKGHGGGGASGAQVSVGGAGPFFCKKEPSRWLKGVVF